GCATCADVARARGAGALAERARPPPSAALARAARGAVSASPPKPYPASGTRELEAVLAAAAIVVIGPFALTAGAALAALATSWRRLWLWSLALPSFAAAIALWPFTRRHALAAATAARHSHVHG